MGTVVVPVVLSGWSGGPTSEGKAAVTWPALGSRAFSALKLVAFGLVVALVLLPVPVIHLAGVGLFVACVGLGVWRLRPGPRVGSVKGPCPHCAHQQRYWTGLNLGPMTLPKKTSCESCTKTLTIEGELAPTA